jgi:hypothetical protein
MNIYEFDFELATDWVIAHNKDEAIEEHASVAWVSTGDYDRAKVRKLRKAEWQDKRYWNEEMGIPEDEAITFAEFMEMDPPIHPEFFTTTEC